MSDTKLPKRITEGRIAALEARVTALEKRSKPAISDYGKGEGAIDMRMFKGNPRRRTGHKVGSAPYGVK
ncbi:MAG TPA: ABC transporter C-terminal domain-containing protein [Steroidobacteraceae bacterium]|nr:ABC transporter C-terminal domain-containing protein [Steroidobacteraceae bacterium]